MVRQRWLDGGVGRSPGERSRPTTDHNRNAGAKPDPRFGSPRLPTVPRPVLGLAEPKPGGIGLLLELPDISSGSSRPDARFSAQGAKQICTGYTADDHAIGDEKPCRGRNSGSASAIASNPPAVCWLWHAACIIN